MKRWEKLRLRLQVTWWQCRDWCLRWIYAQHNARVLADFEHRMGMVIWYATDGMMSKAYYELDVMTNQIERTLEHRFDQGYAEGRKDLADEVGVEDPSPVEVEPLP